jgi:hypothetical protein
MTTRQASGPDAGRSRLRATVAAMDRSISRLPRQAMDTDVTSTVNALLASFADLVEQLELGPEPEVRQCPSCMQIVMLAATRCGYCWNVITPAAAGDRLASTPGG